ncbi:hypothetical protein Vadar_003158 [Vaccinium darrowii]|uniref:Uncharacterized protein n=1 Tax=Vaccinium darrowii TaxID=229202 RepID=A0ACB7Z1K2_9ERIC|nr:hypothetical protein Vadar_003158 [Vaccinium darrowii]
MYMGAYSPTKPNKRGITRGIAHGKKLKPGEKFTVVIPEELLRVVGHDAQAFITEAGIIVRNYAPLQVTDWKKIGQHEKEKLWGWWLQEKFQLQNVHHVRKAVFQQLNRMYRAWRHRLYKFHFLPHKTVENVLQHRPPHLKPEDWEYLCRYFGSKEHTDQMLELRGKSEEDGASPMTDKEICLEVLKKKPGRADEAESQARKLSEEVAMLKANQAEMVAKQEEMNRQNEETQAPVRMMIGELRSRGITRYSSSEIVFAGLGILIAAAWFFASM